jgi:hypothetical protein
MKNFAIIVFTVLILFSIAYSSEDDAGHTYHSKFKGKKYESVMPISILKQSPDFELSKAELPMPLSKIIDVAYSQLIKVTGTKEDWEVMSVTMNNWRINKKKWYYAIGFDQSNIMSLSHITVMVTVDGQLGIIKEINEKIIE